MSPIHSSFLEQLNRSSLTRPMWRLWLLSAGLIGLDGFDFFIIGVAMPFIQQDFGLGPEAVGAIATAAVVGALVGSLTLGPITDRVGRQLMLLVDIGIFILASAGAAFAWNPAALIAFRFLVGVGIGADYPISVSYITENVPMRFRGRMVIGAFSFQAVGALFGALLGIVTIGLCRALAPDSVEWATHYAWRAMLAVGLVLAVLIGLLRLAFLLESPCYYLAKENYKAASESASQLLEQKIELSPATEPTASASRLGYGDLFSRQYLRRTALAALPWFLQDIATYGIGIFTPTIIATLALAPRAGLLSESMAGAEGAAFVNMFLIGGFILAILLVDRVGRISLQVLGFAGMALGLLLLSFSGGGTPGATHYGLLFGGFILFNLAMNAGPNSTTFLLSGEVFPPAIRAGGAGLAAAIAKAGAVVGAYGLPIWQATFGIVHLLRFLSAICVLAAALTYLLRVEVKTESAAEAVEPS
ncbi:MFS transporter [Romeria aff. gracilis LEGE 07310]|uniref:MFS transporter n=1 Tax=Vasconcelosia minhoensis LEGE 07310 TaxID=915328 RepID=A0A8J7ASJ8_9CYAN|nr:MFS transporter [Romeria gracilis]MBE9079951.1 MFS transporter [Romeria aff. gracilis LEGE 07310]